jgi:hypothetical protein
MVVYPVCHCVSDQLTTASARLARIVLTPVRHSHPERCCTPSGCVQMIYARLLAARIAFTGQTFRLRAFVRADQEGCSPRPCPNLSQSAPILPGLTPAQRAINRCKASSYENEKHSSWCGLHSSLQDVVVAAFPINSVLLPLQVLSPAQGISARYHHPLSCVTHAAAILLSCVSDASGLWRRQPLARYRLAESSLLPSIMTQYKHVYGLVQRLLSHMSYHHQCDIRVIYVYI